jgi:hypothetical protein
MPIVKKIANDAHHQFKWLDHLPIECRPPGLCASHSRRHCISCYQYDLIIGDQPTPDELWTTLCRHVWEDKRFSEMTIDRKEYHLYCVNKVHELGFKNRQVMRALDLITAGSELTPVRRCHGDPMICNAKKTRVGQIILLDPGHHRGLPCREIDEAKIMMSIDGWDQVRYGDPPSPWCSKIEVRKIHLVLLMTHYIRLLLHPHIQPAHRFARRRIGEIARTI